MARFFLFLALLFCFPVVLQAGDNEQVKQKDSISFAMREDVQAAEPLQYLLALVSGIGLTVVAIYFLKKKYPQGNVQVKSTSLIRNLESSKLSMKTTLHLVEVENCRYVIVIHGDNVTCVPHDSIAPKL